MKNIGKIILIVLGVALIALGVKTFMDIPAQKAALDAAVYLAEPAVLPENEGKLVIIHGVPEMTAPAYDEELGLTINAIKAYRYAEEYKLISSEKLLHKYNWQSRGQKGIVGEASLGGFALDTKILNAFGADSEYADFDMAELSSTGYVTSHGLTMEGAVTQRLWVIVGGTYYYDAFEYSGNTDIPHIEREIAKGIAEERAGAKAYAYKVYTGNQEKTIAGIQQGNRLVTDETLGPIVRDGVLTKEQVLSANTNGLIGGGIAFLLIGAVLVFLGIRKPTAKTKEA